jgi:hypothetical protein
VPRAFRFAGGARSLATGARRREEQRRRRARAAATAGATDPAGPGQTGPMASLDLSRLSGPDAATALRSYPRRFRAAVLPTPDHENEELAEQVGPDGHSAADHVVTFTNTLVLLGQALRQTLSSDNPVVHAAVTDASEREWAGPGGSGDVAGALARLGDEAGSLADAVDRVEMGQFNRTAQVAGGGEITAFDLVKQAVAAGADHLRAATAAVEAARARRR